MKCWICGNEATTGEHKIKASDLRDLYGRVTPEQPLFLHTDQRRNQKVRSIKSKKLKFDLSLCPHCNNSLTAPYDNAWEQFSNFLREKPSIAKGDSILLHEVFPRDTLRTMLYVHLFFVKLFGCVIVEGRIPIDIGPFTEAILQQRPHPRIFLGFGLSLKMGTGMTDIKSANINGQCVYATWFYTVEPVTVNIIYAEPGEKREGLVNAWHPSTTQRILMQDFC
jgi:hypothetical protein